MRFAINIRNYNSNNYTERIEVSSTRVKASSYIFALYLILLPLSTGLAGIIGSISVANYIAVVYILFSFIELVQNRTIRFRKKLKYIYLYLLYTVISATWNSSITFDWYFTTFATTVFIFCVATLNSHSKKEIQIYIKAVILSSCFVVAVSLFNIIVFRNYRLFITITSTMDPNDFACGLCLILAVYFSLLINKRKTVYVSLMIIAIFSIILLTGSRGAVLMVLGMIAYWILSSSQNRRLKTFLMLAIIIVFVYVFMADTMSAYLLGRFQISEIINSGGSGRLEIWKNAISRYLESSPLRQLFGYGHGGFREAVNYVAKGHSYSYESHNMFINALLEGGAIGLILIVLSFFQAFRFAKRNNNLIGQLCIIGFFIEGLTLDAQSYRIFAIVFTFAVIIDSNTNPLSEVSS